MQTGEHKEQGGPARSRWGLLQEPGGSIQSRIELPVVIHPSVITFLVSPMSARLSCSAGPFELVS